MLSIKLVHLIESNWEEITDRLLTAVKKHPELRHLAALPDLELRDWCREILQNLGYLLSATREEEIRQRFEALGKTRFEEDIPLHELVLRVHVLKGTLIRFIHEQGFPRDAMQLHAEEELEERMGQLFDACVYYLVRGYEKALRLQHRLGSRQA